MLSSFYRKLFCLVPIETESKFNFKIFQDENFIYKRLDFREINVSFCDEIEFFTSNADTYPAFLRLNFLVKGLYYPDSKVSKNRLTHGDVYADFIMHTYRCDYISANNTFLSYFHLDRIILCKYNKFLNSGIPFKVVIPKTRFNFYHLNKDSETEVGRHNTEYLTQKNTDMKHIYLQREGDKTIIQNYSDKFKTFTDLELVNTYNIQKALYGVHRQILYIIALHLNFKQRFGKSPINIEDNSVIGLSGRIIYLPTLNTFEKANEN